MNFKLKPKRWLVDLYAVRDAPRCAAGARGVAAFQNASRSALTPPPPRPSIHVTIDALANVSRCGWRFGIPAPHEVGTLVQFISREFYFSREDTPTLVANGDDISELVGGIRERRREVISAGSDERTPRDFSPYFLYRRYTSVLDNNESFPTGLFARMQFEITIAHAGRACSCFDNYQ